MRNEEYVKVKLGWVLGLEGKEKKDKREMEAHMLLLQGNPAEMKKITHGKVKGMSSMPLDVFDQQNISAVQCSAVPVPLHSVPLCPALCAQHSIIQVLAWWQIGF